MSQIRIKPSDITHLSINFATTDYLAANYQGKVRLNGCDYVVSLQNGRVGVTRHCDSIIKKIFYRNYAQQMQQRLQGQIQHVERSKEALKLRIINVAKRTMLSCEKRLHSTAKRNNLQVLQKLFPPANPGNAILLPRRTREVALYGYEFTRAHATSAVKKFNKSQPKEQAAQSTKIDIYNADIGITWSGVNAKNLPKLLQQIRTGTTQGPQNGNRLSTDQQQAWRIFLKNHAHRVDIFAKIANYLQEGAMPATETTKRSGWSHEVRQKGPLKALDAFVRKNMSAEDLNRFNGKSIREVAVGILFFVETLKVTREIPTPEFVTDFLQSYFGTTEQGKIKADAFNRVIQGAFFRQTSKLGLEFFRDQKVPVLFQCYNPRGVEIRTAGTGNNSIADKWWHTEDYGPNRYASATFSEMRHLQRLLMRNEAPEVIQIWLKGPSTWHPEQP